jgi:TatA/E family protein of Tat protein translocase
MSTLAVTMPGGAEWIIILVVFILLFGAKKLPELGSSVGKSIKNFKRGLGEGDAAEDETTSSPTATRDQQ